MADKYINDVGLQAIKEWSISRFTNKIDKISVNGVEQTITNKEVDLSVPEVGISGGEEVSISTPDTGDGVTLKLVSNGMTVAFDGGSSDTLTSKTYVDENGGKIDKIKVNGVEQTITNKEVDLKVPEVSYTGAFDTVGAEGRINTQGSTRSDDAIILKKTTEGLSIAASIDDNGEYRGFGAINVYSKATADSTFRTEQQVQAAIDAALADVTGIDFKVVDALPTEGVKGTIYLVSNAGTTPNTYDEYIWITPEGGTAYFEKIGTTDVDLSNYWTMTAGQANSLVAMTVAEINAILEA